MTWVNARTPPAWVYFGHGSYGLPGARFLRQPRPEMFECPDCGEEVEIWSDEIRGTCSACGKHETRFWTTDLSYDYIKINAEYHT